MAKMVPFSIEQLEFLQTQFGINPLTDRIHIRDGIASKTDHLWVRQADGPKHVSAKLLWKEIQENPQSFSFKKPEVKVEYLD